MQLCLAPFVILIRILPSKTLMFVFHTYFVLFLQYVTVSLSQTYSEKVLFYPFYQMTSYTNGSLVHHLLLDQPDC